MIGIFQRLFAEKKAEDDRIQDEYHSMLFDLASGKEVDEDDVRRLTIDSGRTEEQCSRDLETMIQRIAKVKEKQDWTKIQDGIPALQKKYDALRDELNETIKRIQPQLVRLEWDLHAASDPKVIWINDFLSRTCLNQSLLEREQEVGSQRKALGMQKRTLAEDLSKARQHESYFLARLEKYNRKDGSKPKDAVDFKELQASRAEWQSTIEQLEIAIRNIDEQLEPVDAELADIQIEKLLP
jgi:hypothetical protein